MARSKFLPHLSDYLNTRHALVVTDRVNGPAGMSMILSMGALFAGGYWALDTFTDLSTLPRIAIAFFAIAMPLGSAIGGAIAESIKNNIRRNQPQAAEIEEIHTKLKEFLNSGKLHRNIEPSAAALLEQAAKQWMRIHTTLNSATWTNERLSSHWLNLKQHLKLASDQAMDEVLVLLKSSVQKQPDRAGWESSFKDILETVFGVPNLPEAGHLSAEYGAAHTTAQKLVELADQVEASARKMAQEPEFNQSFSSTTSIDACLAELKDLHAAETELKDQLRQL